MADVSACTRLDAGGTSDVRVARGEDLVQVRAEDRSEVGLGDWARHGAAPEAPLEDVQVSTVPGMSAPAEGAAWAAGLREKAQELGRRMPR
ncbi:hypothetical protein R6L23_00870 [Streptomyces sp. SR27]|uniref:hypothetical protein n=1 Tax=Streptomyces sp. SR27 TaxID=3076630 RepID=UPI00295BD658|nr:hypothetical protein [Streptomyces sp. SR27]MDV9186802.1 hypothetical protein [Streptomyces sp. SR27]